MLYRDAEKRALITMDYGFMTLLPTLLVLGLAIWSRRTLESVLAGALFAFFIIDGLGFLDLVGTSSSGSADLSSGFADFKIFL